MIKNMMIGIIIVVLLALVAWYFLIYKQRMQFHTQAFTPMQEGYESLGPVGTISQSWANNTLTVTVIESVYCGGKWISHDYAINGSEIRVIAKWQGFALNCGVLPTKLTFIIPNVPKGEYKITPDISQEHVELKP